MSHLVVGLGNPGSAYRYTRHNMGFLCVQKMAEKSGASFRRLARIPGKIASAMLGTKSVYFLIPSTYMNNSGVAVSSAASYLRVPLTHILVVCDDIYLPFGSLRMRPGGSAGGHNGLKSIEAHLHTSEYARLRVGIGERTQGELADYVLGQFDTDEKKELPNIIEKATVEIEQWLIGE